MKYPDLLLRCLLPLLLFNLVACASMQTVSVESAMQHSQPPSVDYGSLVRVRTLDNRTAEFRVTEITQEGLGGKSGFFHYQDMESLKVSGPERQGNWGAVFAGILGVAALVYLVDNSDEVRLCSGAPCPGPDP